MDQIRSVGQTQAREGAPRMVAVHVGNLPFSGTKRSIIFATGGTNGRTNLRASGKDV